jgi:hypothetical protein
MGRFAHLRLPGILVLIKRSERQVVRRALGSEAGSRSIPITLKHTYSMEP